MIQLVGVSSVGVWTWAAGCLLYLHASCFVRGLGNYGLANVWTWVLYFCLNNVDLGCFNFVECGLGLTIPASTLCGLGINRKVPRTVWTWAGKDGYA